VNAVGYIRVSTEEQRQSGLSLEAQRAAIRGECQRRGWVLNEIFEDIASGKSTNGRHGLKQAIAMCESKRATVLMAASLDRISRSTLDFATLAEQARHGGWAINVLDISMDMTTPHGEAMATMAMAFAHLERRLISTRTKAAMAQAKTNGVQLGRPVVTTTKTRRRIRGLRTRGLSWQGITRHLNERGVLTDTGCRWHPTTVRQACLPREHQMRRPQVV
jgi:DNA invertase Pin-like site-specific DNA recombinase